MIADFHTERLQRLRIRPDVQVMRILIERLD